MSTFKAQILTGDIHEKSDGSTNIKIRVTHNRKIRYIKTEYFVLPDNFDNKKGEVTGGDDKENLNFKLLEKITEYKRKDIALGEERQFMTVAQIKEHLLKKTVTFHPDIEFYSFAKNQIEITDNKGTAETYKNLINSLKSFYPDDLYFRKISYRFIINYERYLKSRGVKNGIINYMSSFRALFNDARRLHNDEEIGIIKIPHYPFSKYEMPERKNKSTQEHVLEPHEFKMFLNDNPKKAGEQFAKDMFLLMFLLVGIEGKDLFYAPNTKDRLKYDRFKTDRSISIKIEPEAQAIIDKYKTQKSLIGQQLRYRNHKAWERYINEHLHGVNYAGRVVQGIFPRLGINKNVTTKWAKHTWGTFARNECRINKSDIAFSLGHKDQENKTTDIYARTDNRIIDESNRKVIDFAYYSQEY